MMSALELHRCAESCEHCEQSRFTGEPPLLRSNLPTRTTEMPCVRERRELLRCDSVGLLYHEP
jgi:hypothetical protein